MINLEILQGLKYALSKRESLQSAMQSFYNSGYKKEEIEEAARALQLEMLQIQNVQQTPARQISQEPRLVQKEPQTTSLKKEEYKPLGTFSTVEQIQKPEQKQKISNYEREQKDVFTIILIIILILLLITLVGVFIFKQKIVEFLNSLF